MKNFQSLLRSFFVFQKNKALKSLHNLSFFQGSLGKYLLEKYFWAFCLILLFSFVSLGSYIRDFLLKNTEDQSQVSLDQLVPQGFVLVPIEISNGGDLFPFVGNYAVVDLYLDSQSLGLPDKQIASRIKIFPPQIEEGLWTALIPEKEVIYLFEYVSAFYAVIQNPKKRDSKIYKKQKTNSLIVIEESF